MRKLLSVLLLLCLAFQLAACSLGGKQHMDTSVSADTSVKVTSVPETDAPETTFEITTEAEVLPAPPADGTLLYYQDFEDTQPLTGEALLTQLGWEKIDKAQGASTSGTAAYSIKKRGDGKALYINNYSGIASPSDSYVRILPADVFGYFCNGSYTLQYDLEYTAASSVTRYINIITDYSPTCYHTFHFRNGGYGNSQVFLGSEWLSVEAADSAAIASDTLKTSECSIVYKLLGKYYDGYFAFSNVPVSVRCVYEENSVNVYMRLKKSRFAPEDGEWVLVSASSKNSAGGKYLGHPLGGGELVLKTGGAQDGFIDNIILWAGTGDEPADKSSGYLYKNAKCHEYVSDTEKGKVCVFCGKTEGPEWLLSVAPKYIGGVYASRLYMDGQKVTRGLPVDSESKMQLIGNTNENEFAEYISLLNGMSELKQESYRVSGDNIYAAYRFVSGENAGRQIYTYLTGKVGEVRVIESAGSALSAAEFGYEYTPAEGDSTIIYQYGLPMDSKGLGVTESATKMTNCGMMYAIKAADNSVIIIDGGSYMQFDSAQSAGLIKFLREVTGTPVGSKVRISAWIITHGHQDHLAGFSVFLSKYSSHVTVERIAYNFPSVYGGNGTICGIKDTLTKFGNYVDKYIGSDYKYLKPYTGQQFNIADVAVDVVYSHEDLTDPASAISEIAGDFNNSCSVYRISAGGVSFLVTGDINKPAKDVIMDTQPKSLIKTDILQPAHHMFNNLVDMYSIAKAKAVLIPQSRGGATRTNTRVAMMAILMRYAENDAVFYANEGTVGLQVKDGSITKVYSAPVHGGGYGNWGW